MGRSPVGFLPGSSSSHMNTVPVTCPRLKVLVKHKDIHTLMLKTQFYIKTGDHFPWCREKAVTNEKIG
jgi:hypothetical protein